MSKIEKIIRKAECIREYLEENNKQKGNIDQLIASLKSYQEKYGELPPKKRHCIIVYDMFFEDIMRDLPVYAQKVDFDYHYCVQDRKYAIVVESSEFTDHIKDAIFPYIEKEDGIIVSLPSSVIGYDIADAVWDIESTKVDDIKLTNKFISAGLKPISNNIKFAKDFE